MYVFINTNRPESRGRLVKSNRQLRDMSTGDDVFNAGPLKRYQARPDGEPFDNMSLAHFSVWYNVADKNYEPTSCAQPRYELKNDLGKIYLRRKQACLRISTIIQESHGDSYYYHSLFLYLPWRNKTLDLIQNHESAQASFVANKNKLQVLSSEQHSSFADEVQ